MSIDTAFRAIYERNPTPEETNRFNRIAKELGIRDNDAIWAMMFLSGHYIDLAKHMPDRIQELTAKSLTEHAQTIGRAHSAAKKDFAVIKARIEENISHAVVTSAQEEIAKAAQTVARHTARKSWLQWLGGAAVAGMVIVSGAFYWGYNTGNSMGYARALDVKLASSWAATDIGKAAYRLDQSGDLRAIVQCDRGGWKVERSRDGKQKICVVYPTADGETFGWYLPIQ